MTEQLQSSHRLAPTLHYRPSGLNRSLLSSCPSLQAPYRPTPWASNAHMQIALYMRADARSPSIQWDQEERLTMDDGGTVSLQWVGLSPDVSKDTPVLLFLPTITGSGDTLRGMILRLQQALGWIVVACNRRGLGDLPMTSPRFNTLGNTDDLRVQIDAIRRIRPDAPLFALGVSAGSGLLARYLGEEEEGAVLKAGVMMCPAYDMRDAFQRLHWFYDRFMTRKVIQTFLLRHEAALKEVPGYWEAREAKSFGDLHDQLYALGGFEDREAFYKGTNPMEVAHRNCTPSLVLNAVDDPICTRKSLEDGIESLRHSLDKTVIAVTKHGSHCSFFEGTRQPRSWAERVIVEYLQAAHEQLV